MKNSNPALSIVGQKAPLRASGPFVSPQPDPDLPGSALPRALRGLARIVDGGLCHRCGSCIGICPTQVLCSDGDDYPAVKNLSACTDCDLCVRVCPGDEFDFASTHERVLGAPGNIRNTHGVFLDAAVCYSSEPQIREHSTSGGAVTAVLLHLLETGRIDGAAVITSDSGTLWKGKAIIARSRDEVLSAMKSKYAICATNAAFAEIRERPGRYAVVGLPCQIHGFHKAAALDSRLKERVVLTIGLFCHAAIEHEAFKVIWETLGDKKQRAVKFISRVGKHPGTPHVVLDDGTLYPVYFGDRSGYRPTSIEVINVIYRLFTPERCTTCFDGLSDFADISVGDPWMAPPEDHVDWRQGWSFVLLRTERGRAAFQASISEGRLVSLAVTKREALASNKLMAQEKRWRAFRVIETRRRQGKPIPLYGTQQYEFPKHRGLQLLKTELHMLSHLFCFMPKYRASVLRFFLGPAGYWLFWLNHKRRRLRTGSRDLLARVRRRLRGRR